MEHENVLKFLGFILEKGRPSCVTPWMRNGSLKVHIEAGSLIPIHPMVSAHAYSHCARTKRYDQCLGIARGLAYLHGKNVVHGDLKSVGLIHFIFNSLVLKHIIVGERYDIG